MMHDGFSDDPGLIEAELARERASLAGNINSLRNTLTFDTVVDDALQFAMSRVGPITQTVDAAVRANPLAAAMTAAGLAWLIFGRKSPPQPASEPLAGSRYEAMSRWEDEGGPVAPLPEPDEAWIFETESLRQRAMAALSDIDAATRLRLRPAADLARERAAIVADMAAATTQAMARGLENVSAASREKIIAARHRAYAAQAAVAKKGASVIEDHPLLAGAVALAVGAAIARALPMSDTENRVIGPERDRLLAEAHALLLAERARLAGLAAAA